MALRPTKTFLFIKVSENLKYIKKKVGIDFACGDGKNSIYFKTKKYIGIDKDKKILEVAKKRYPEHSFKKENIVNFNCKKYSSDVVLSTNTFEHINPKLRKKAFRNLINIVKKNGVFIIDSNRDYLLNFKMKELHKNFAVIKLIFFRNYINFMIENFYLKNNFLYFFFRFSGIITLLTYMEYLTSKIKFFNKSVLIIAKYKR
jgi:SAM-dependent methyltransferase